MVRATFKRGAKVARWERKLDNPTAALKQIGALMLAESQGAFKRQRFGKVAWKPRGVPNVFGIIADLHKGSKEPPKRRFEPRPALRDTGRLSGSISFKLKGKNSIEVGSNLPYASVHQKGGKVESMPVTEKVQKALWKWLKNKGSAWKDDLGWLLNKKFRNKKLEGTVPARPFVGITRLTRRDVKEVVGVSIMEAK